MTPIIDLHCDMLLYLAEKEGRTPESAESRCSLSQLQSGGVTLQTLAIYCPTKKGSHTSAWRQLKKFRDVKSAHCKFTAAIENASGLLEEDEEWSYLPPRLKALQEEVGKPLYISLTWNTENRFGGGNETNIGLKEDGKKLLEMISGQKVAIDLSHTSDKLAYDILTFIDTHQLQITPIASHSNFRAITNVPRNLPDEIAKEIIRRGGLIGLNVIRKFVGENFDECFIAHVLHAKKLGALPRLCFGADFFCESDSPTHHPLAPFFTENYGNASCYPKLLALLTPYCTPDELQGIAHKNALQFLQR